MLILLNVWSVVVKVPDSLLNNSLRGAFPSMALQACAFVLAMAVVVVPSDGQKEVDDFDPNHGSVVDHCCLNVLSNAGCERDHDTSLRHPLLDFDHKSRLDLDSHLRAIDWPSSTRHD